MIEIELEGWREVEQMFERLGEEGVKALQMAFTETAIEAVSNMRTNSPVQTGRLRSSMHYETPIKKEYSYSVRDKKTKTVLRYDGRFNLNLQGVSAAFGTNVEYADSANARSRSPFFFDKAFEFAQNKLEERLSVNYEKAINKVTK